MKLNEIKHLPRTAMLFGLIGLLQITTVQAQETAVADKQTDAPDYKVVIGDFLEATGGEMAHGEIKAMVTKGTISLPEAGIEGEMTITQMDNKGLMVMSMAGIGEQRTGFDGETAWQISEMTGPEILEGEQRDQMVSQMNVSPFLNIDEIYENVECTGMEDFNGEDCYVVKVSNDDQEPIYHYFSVESKLHTGTKMVAVSQMGSFEIVTRLSDYREVGGVKMPFLTTAELPQGMTMETKMETMEVNPDLDDSVFALPDEIEEIKN